MIKTISLNPNYFSEPPSRACLVCEKTEKENARIIYDKGAWLCDRCRSALLKLIKDFNATSNASNALNALEQENKEGKMTDYIKREDALKAMEWKWAGKAAFDAVKAVPSADVVEVVRCKDCVKANADSDERYMYCTKCHEYKLVDYYCAEGRRGDG